MYYRRYFQAELEAIGTQTIQYYDASGTSKTLSPSYPLLNDYLGESIVTVLNDIGMKASYDKNTELINPNTDYENSFRCMNLNSRYSPITYYPTYRVEGDETYITRSVAPGSETGMGLSKPGSSSSANYGICEYNSSTRKFKFKFYITVRGEPDSAINISIGLYTTPTSTSAHNIYMAWGHDHLKDRPVFMLYASYGSTKSFGGCFRYADDNTIPYPMSITYNKTYIVQSAAYFTILEEKIPLIEFFLMYGGWITADNCYFNPGLPAESFYRINGVKYYTLTNNVMVKCLRTIV